MDTCRECCTHLPSYERVRGLVLRDAMRAQVLALNHDTDPQRRDRSLMRWAEAEFPEGHEASWYELTGAASAGLATFALLALACEPDPAEREIARTHAAYFPWASAVACMLDSYADQAEDANTATTSTSRTTPPGGSGHRNVTSSCVAACASCTSWKTVRNTS